MKTVARSVRAPRRGTRMSAVCLCAGLLGTCPLSGEEVATGQSGNSAATELLRPGSWLTEEVFFQGGIPNQLASAPAEAEPPQTRNSVELAVGGVLTHGHFAQFQQQYGLPRNVFGGIQEGHFEQDIGKRGLFTLDGHAIIDTHDYDITLSFTQPDLGYIRGGYNEFRTYSDPNGGFFPLNSQFFTPTSGVFALDRGDAWVELGLRMPSLPQITLRYDHFFRYGQEDSTSWGVTGLTGLTSNNLRFIVPSFRDINEKRDVFTADISQTFGITDFKLGFRYEYVNNKDSLNFNQNPNTKSSSFVTQHDDLKYDLFSVHVSSVTRFSDKLWFTAAYAYTALNSQIGGSRIYGTTFDAVYDPLFPQRATRQTGFLDLSGGSRLDQHVVNLNLDWRPSKGLSILAAVRVEDQNTKSDSTGLSTDFVSGPSKSIVASNDPQSNNGTYDFLSVDESLEVRYTGLANWAFYARGEWREEQNHLNSRQVDLLTNTFLLNASTDESNLLQKYIIGANWYPFSKLNFAAQYYHAIREYDYSNSPDNSYPFFFTKQVFTVDDVNFRFTWRPFTSISLVGRYDFQRSTIDTAGGGLGQVQSAVIRNHIFSADVVWTPFGSFYLQGNLSYVLDETDTPASHALPGPVVTNFKNNYWDAGCSAGVSLDDKTDLQVQYTYYNADDYINNARFSQPYGSGAVQQSVTASISRRISNNLRLTLKYGYFTFHDITSGGHNNYNANLIHGSLEIRF